MARRRAPATATFERVAFRYSSYDTPFWVRPDTRPGRWHSAGEGPTQYLSTTTDGAWADLVRNEELRSDADAAMVSMPLWQARVDQSYVVDYSTFELAERSGFAGEALVDDDQQRCRAEGSRLRDLGYAGVLAPSAALPGATNLTLFGPRVSTSWESEPTLASAIPAAMLTHGAPPLGLVARVRFRGQVHAGLREHLAQRSRPRRHKP
jgi:RES domain-containing protein